MKECLTRLVNYFSLPQLTYDRDWRWLALDVGRAGKMQVSSRPTVCCKSPSTTAEGGPMQLKHFPPWFGVRSNMTRLQKNKWDSLPVIDQAKRGRVEELGFPTGVEPSQVSDDICNYVGILVRQFKLPFGPAGDVSIKILRLPA